ncbi:MAG: hypothetical protein ABI808_03920 [Pseudonocardiales bacterium]
MQTHRVLLAELAQLSQALDDPDVDLDAELRRLSDDLTRVAESYLGLRITIETTGAGRVCLTRWRDSGSPGDAHGSLFIPLPLICAAAPGSALVLYAGHAGAFTDLAADLSWALSLPLSAFTLDQHTHEHDPAGKATPSGLVVFSLVNQAIGVLIAWGRTHEQAQDELRRQATDARSDLPTAATAIIESIGPGTGPRLV